MKDMKTDTELATLGLAPECLDGIVNMPVTRASTILFKNLADFDAGSRGEYKLPTYARNGTPISHSLEAALAKLEGADHALVFPSGLSAISTALLAFTGHGDHVLMVDTVYTSTRPFCDQELIRFGVEITYYDPLIGASIAGLIRPNTRVIYLESPGSLTFEMQDIDVITAEAKKRGITVISDNTWATPLYFRPFDRGIDISMHSATKYISGHSDMLMGVLSCKSEHYAPLLRTARNLGLKAAPDTCYLALRGLRTMALRLKRHQESALQIAQWLKKRPEVVEVYYPALPGAPGHDLWKHYYTGACGLFSVQLKPMPHTALAALIDGLELFGIGFSWGGFESLIVPCYLQKVRSATQWPHEGPLLRLHIGLEHPDDLIRDLEQGLTRAVQAQKAGGTAKDNTRA